MAVGEQGQGLGAGHVATRAERGAVGPEGGWAAWLPANNNYTVAAAANNGDAHRRNKRKDGERVKR